MNIKIKYLHKNGETRIENQTEIKEVLFHEDLFNPKNEKIAIGFRNDASSGLIEFTPEEFDKLFHSVKSKLKFVKGFKILKG
ncbi:MAG: hypothetical protein QXW97_04455 [Candidatus Pacearchaeota archaeon]